MVTMRPPCTNLTSRPLRPPGRPPPREIIAGLCQPTALRWQPHPRPRPLRYLLTCRPITTTTPTTTVQCKAITGAAMRHPPPIDPGTRPPRPRRLLRGRPRRAWPMVMAQPLLLTVHPQRPRTFLQDVTVNRSNTNSPRRATSRV